MNYYEKHRSKTAQQLEYIAQDAMEAATAMKDVNSAARLQYLNEAAAAEQLLGERRGTVRSELMRQGMV